MPTPRTALAQHKGRTICTAWQRPLLARTCKRRQDPGDANSLSLACTYIHGRLWQVESSSR